MRMKGFIGLLGGLLASSCGFSSDEVRYRLTVEVETPEGLKSGSGVMGFQLAPGFPQSYAPSFRGEAIAVDLGSRGTLFMILTGRSEDGHPSGGFIEMLPENAFRRVGVTRELERDNAGDRIETLNFLSKKVGLTANLECSYSPFNPECPFFVRFRDDDAPMSVEAVDPNDLASSFGNGVKIRLINIEITDDDVSTGIEKRLKWIKNPPEGHLDPNYRSSTNPELHQILLHRDFKRIVYP